MASYVLHFACHPIRPLYDIDMLSLLLIFCVTENEIGGIDSDKPRLRLV